MLCESACERRWFFHQVSAGGRFQHRIRICIILAQQGFTNYCFLLFSFAKFKLSVKSPANLGIFFAGAQIVVKSFISAGFTVDGCKSCDSKEGEYMIERGRVLFQFCATSFNFLPFCQLRTAVASGSESQWASASERTQTAYVRAKSIQPHWPCCASCRLAHRFGCSHCNA